VPPRVRRLRRPTAQRTAWNSGGGQRQIPALAQRDPRFRRGALQGRMRLLRGLCGGVPSQQVAGQGRTQLRLAAKNPGLPLTASNSARRSDGRAWSANGADLALSGLPAESADADDRQPVTAAPATDHPGHGLRIFRVNAHSPLRPRAAFPAAPPASPHPQLAAASKPEFGDSRANAPFALPKPLKQHPGRSRPRS